MPAVVYDIAFLDIGWRYEKARTGIFNVAYQLLKAFEYRLFVYGSKLTIFSLKFLKDRLLPCVVILLRLKHVDYQLLAGCCLCYVGFDSSWQKAAYKTLGIYEHVL